jgi:hypothetical protein
MARVIEFHVPGNHQPKKRWTAPEPRGKLLQFPPRMQRKPAPPKWSFARFADGFNDLPVLRQVPMW